MKPHHILEELNIQILNYNAGHTESLHFVCPNCGKPKSYMYQDSPPFFVRCFAGGEHLSTTLYGLYAQFYSISYKEAKELCEKKLDISSPDVHISKPSLPKEEVTKIDEWPKGWKRIQKTDRIPHIEYLKNRGFTWQNVDMIDVSWNGDYFSSYVMFPIYEDSQLMSYEKRCIVSKENWNSEYPYIKTMAPKGVKNNQFLYGIDFIRYNNRIILTEGIPNWVSLHNAGFNVAGVFGSNPSQRQISLLKRFNPVAITLGFDGDHAGINAIGKAKQWLNYYFPKTPVDVWLIPYGRDANDIRDRNILQRSFKNRRSETLAAVMHA